MICYRVSAYDTPCPPSPSRRAGRWGVAGSEVVNYWSSHPYAAWAEVYRYDGIDADAIQTISQRLWVGRFDHLDILDLTGADGGEWGLTTGDMVDDDWSKCQDAARNLREANVDAISVPSAALAGATNVVLFGQRIAIEFDVVVEDPEIEIPCAVAADASIGIPDVLQHVRHHGVPWSAGRRVPQSVPTPLA